MSKSRHHGSADDRGSEASGGKTEGGRRGARGGGVQIYTLYASKAKYDGMDVSQAKEGKQLRHENTELRKLVADLSLDKEARSR